MGSLQKLVMIAKSYRVMCTAVPAVCYGVAYARIHTTSNNVGVDSNLGVLNACSVGLGRLFDHVRDVLDRLQLR